MTDDATPKPTRTYARPTRYPARIAVMLTATQRAEIDAIAAEDEATLGETVRELIEIGLDDRIRRNQD